jgi:DNA gyrase/topoisomerase IV subunit B
VNSGRFKGLGEMNAEELADTTMDVNARTLMKVEIDDAAMADDIFSMLMGEKVQPRNGVHRGARPRDPRRRDRRVAPG